MTQSALTTTRFTQIGWTSIFVCVAGSLFSGVFMWAMHAPLVAGLFAASIPLLAGAMCRTLTIDVDLDRVTWHYPGKYFADGVPYSKLTAYRPETVDPSSVLFRVVPGRSVWLVHGRRVVRLETTARTYLVGADNPEAVCESITRHRNSPRTNVAPTAAPAPAAAPAMRPAAAEGAEITTSSKPPPRRTIIIDPKPPDS